MNFKSIFEIRKSIIICRVRGVFSTDDVQRIYQHFRELVTEMPKPFGILMDMREFQGTTPQGYEEAESFNQWLASHELAAKVNLVSTGIIKKIVEQRIPSRKNYKLQEFLEEKQALEYLDKCLIDYRDT